MRTSWVWGLTFVAMVAGSVAQAGVITWKGGSSGNVWNVAANWNGGVLPTTGDTAVVGAGTCAITSTLSPAPDLIRLDGGTTQFPANTANNFVANGGLLQAGGSATVSGMVQLTANTTISNTNGNSNRALVFTNTISEDGTPRQLTFSGTTNDNTNLSGANTYSGGTIVTGQVAAQSSGALGTGPVAVNGGKLKLAYSGTYTFGQVTSNNGTVAIQAPNYGTVQGTDLNLQGGTLTYGASGNSSSTLDNSNTVNTSGTVNVNTTGGYWNGPFQIGASIAGSAKVNLGSTGQSRLVIGATQQWTGGTEIGGVVYTQTAPTWGSSTGGILPAGTVTVDGITHSSYASAVLNLSNTTTGSNGGLDPNTDLVLQASGTTYGTVYLATNVIVHTLTVNGAVIPAGFYGSADLPDYIVNSGSYKIRVMTPDVGPNAITDLAGTSPDWFKIDLTWTAPADNIDPIASTYDIRYSTSQITDANFNDATPITAPAPLSPGQQQTLAVTGLHGGTTYYFAAKSADAGNNLSDLSNVVAVTTPPLDVTPPAAISNLAVAAIGANHIRLSWTAPGDDGNTGTASTYDLRYSTSPITGDASFAAATPLTGLAAPRIAGSAETATISGLVPSTTYYIAIKAADEVPNWSTISNVIPVTTGEEDFLPPLPITDLTASAASGNSVTLNWTAPADQGSAGTASYDLRYSTSPITSDADFAAAVVVTGLPVPAAPGTAEQFTVTGLLPWAQYYFAIKTTDAAEVPNTSALSNVPSATTPTDLAVRGQPRQINTLNSSGYVCFNPVATGGRGSYRWDLASNPGSCFTIDATYGSVKPARALAAGSYPITVRVTDASGAMASEDVAVAVISTGIVVINTDTIFDNYAGSNWFCTIGIYADGFTNTATGTTWTITDPSGRFGVAGGYNYLTLRTGTPPAGDYPIRLSLVQNGNALGPFDFTIHVVPAQKITSVSFVQNVISTSQGAGVVVGTASTTVWEPGYQWSIPFAGSDGGTFTILDATKGVVSLTRTPALGDRSLTIQVKDGLNTYSQTFTVHVVEGTTLPAGNMSLTVPTNLDNFTSSGTIGTPAVTGITGTPAWSFSGDGVGYRYAIDPATGTITIIGCLSYNPTIDGVDYSDVITVTCTDGVNTCTNSFKIPVAACVGPVLNVGPGQQFAHLNDAIVYVWNNSWGKSPSQYRSYAGVTFNVYPSDDPNYYKNDGQWYPINGNFRGPVTIQGAPGQRFPKFWGGSLYYAKGFFMSYNYDLFVRNVEICKVTTGGTGSSNDNEAAVVKESGCHTGNVFLDNFYIHDCQDGIARGGEGCKWFVTNGRISHCGIGETGYTHNIYVQGDLGYFKNVLTDQSCVGHTFKTRCNRTIIDSCRVYDGELGHGSCGIDLPEGGIDTIINTVVQKGPNWQNSYSLNFASRDSHAGWPWHQLTASGCVFLADVWNPSQVWTLINRSLPGAADGTPASAVLTGDSFFGYVPANYATISVDGPTGAVGTNTVSNSTALTVQPPLDWHFPGPGPDPTIDSPPGPFLAPYGVVGGAQITLPVDEIRISAGAAAGALVVQPTWLPGNTGATSPTWSLRKNPGNRYAIDPTTGTITTAAPLTPGKVDVLEINVAQAGIQFRQFFGGQTYYDHPSDGSFIHSIYVVVSAPGDVDGDGQVNLADLKLLVGAWNSTPASGNWNTAADFDGDSSVNLSDLKILVAHWNS